MDECVFGFRFSLFLFLLLFFFFSPLFSSTTQSLQAPTALHQRPRPSLNRRQVVKRRLWPYVAGGGGEPAYWSPRRTTNSFIWLEKPANRRIDWLQVDRQTSLSRIGRHPLKMEKQKTSGVSKSAAAIQSKREKNSKIYAAESHSPNREVPK